MNKFTLVLSAVGTANAYFSEYWRNYEETVAALQCEAPVVCGEDVCDVGQACKVLMTGDAVCDDVYKYQCANEDGQRCMEQEEQTGVAQVLSPLSYCGCVSEQERNAMFCQEAFDMLYNMGGSEGGASGEGNSSNTTDMKDSESGASGEGSSANTTDMQIGEGEESGATSDKGIAPLDKCGCYGCCGKNDVKININFEVAVEDQASVTVG